ncbi:E3 ubiquitin-protein ligase COP1 isoform X2 [Beta vulgaris subsp. vulgaris]|uniref:E3 ubiquitin-protein ligase COP1 isoform X2 n=1 Tax=Beta vulgaris subsp. vulgaris TaxID=3555 RepID=UPI00203727A4|nr:E3 ubiquitin-protein ligase COP1 isoform X2 [Beta vulgaris subsp. vulgaris]
MQEKKNYKLEPTLNQKKIFSSILLQGHTTRHIYVVRFHPQIPSLSLLNFPLLSSLTRQTPFSTLSLSLNILIFATNSLSPPTSSNSQSERTTMAETSIGEGALVPFVKADSPHETSDGGESISGDKDFLCPICMQIIKDAFLTACGHSYCYMCIFTHLRNKSDCPCCSRFLTPKLIFPNFALDKILKKMSNYQFAKSASSSEKLRRALLQGCDVSVKDLDCLLSQLAEKKRKMEQEEAETNLQVLLEFLVCLRKRKLEELSQIQNDLQYIKEDIEAVRKHKIDLGNVNKNCTVRLRFSGDDSDTKGDCPIIPRPVAGNSGTQQLIFSGSQHNGRENVGPLCSQEIIENDGCAGSESQQQAPTERFTARKRQVEAQLTDLQECYLQKRRHWAKQLQGGGRDLNNINSLGYHAGLRDFQSVLTSCTRYSQLRVISELRLGNVFQPANIISSIEFDRDHELFATAGVSKRIKIFELSSVIDEPAEVHCAVVDIATRSKLSCLSWNKYTKHCIASSDYEGIVTVWDVATRQSVGEYEEHEKRAWSVDFSCTEPSLLVSGGDDCKVKVWCTKQERSVLNIDMNANICSVKCNPGSSMHVAVGSADHNIHYYDLRNITQPVHVFSGHRKAVSYVKFLSTNELASASTDSTLRLWDVKENKLLQIYRGHMNEKNFVGLTSNSEYLSCGSETNEVFVYHKAISKPVARYKFNTSEFHDADEDRGSHFISAVCWKSDGSPVIMAANSQGNVKVLALAT